jgi:6-phosphogluconolactonase
LAWRAIVKALAGDREAQVSRRSEAKEPMKTSRALFRILPALLLAWLASSALPARAGNAPAYLVYVGTFTQHGSKGIYLMHMDASTGALSEPELVAEAASPAFLALHPNHHLLYSVNEVDKGSISAFAIDEGSGKLTFLNQQPSQGHAPTHLVVDPEGKNVLAANYGSGSVAVLPIEPDGKLAPPSSVDQHEGRGADPSRQGGPHAHCVNIDPSGHYAVSCDLGLDKIFVYRFDPQAHTITPNDPPFVTVAPASGPRHLAFSPEGRNLYVVDEMACTVTAFHCDAGHGTLTGFQTISTLPDDFHGQKSTAEIAVHPSGRFLYASNRGDANSIAIFTINSSDGKLTTAGHVSTQGRAPRDFAIDPTGKWLLAANQDTDNIVEFRIDPESGALQPSGVSIKTPTPVCITFLPASK